jgi:pimeloyl-ACP methyl ester carboxylesterase
MQQLVAQGAPEQLGRIRGIIFDSSPAQVIPDVAARALVAAVLGEPAEKVQERHPLLVGGTSAAVGAYLKVPLIKHCIQEVHDTWAQLAPPCPMLFLHSAADVLVPPEVVQAFMKQQAARGAAVSDKLWPDSPHVDHWRAYPQEYEQQLQRFASRVLHPDAGDSDCDAGRDWSIPAGRERG